MKISRYFTRPGHDPLADLLFVEREVVDPSTSQGFTFTAPASWSDTAVSILATKYRYASRETDARQLFLRLANAWTVWGKRLGYFDSEEDGDVFRDEILFMISHQIASPNSPQWFNTGLHEAYGLRGDPQGHWYVDDHGQPHASPDAYSRPQAHACFIQSVKDDLVGPGGIFDLWVREARLFKHGAGSGTNFSSLRGKGEGLSAGGQSSGLLSFLKVGDATASAIESGGTTRRAAKMVIVDLDHPDIEAFIAWKAREEEKVALLLVGSAEMKKLWPTLREASTEAIEALARTSGFTSGFLLKLASLAKSEWETLPVFDTDWRGEAYRTVSGQNSNNSVRVPDRFFETIDRDDKWELRSRTAGATSRSIRARDLWGQIGIAAWACADPGVQFADTIQKWHTCPGGGEIRASNPCAEYLFLDDTGCNLASLNLVKFYDSDTTRFDTEGFSHAAGLWTLVLEITVAMAQFPTEAIAANTFAYRTLGIGYANLGTLLMLMGLPYGSEEARSLAAALTSLITSEGYSASADLAEQKGPFARYHDNQEPMLRVIEKHATASQALSWTKAPGKAHDIFTLLKTRADQAWARATAQGKRHGFRNAQISAIAPTGTIGLVMDCDTLGIEPEFAFTKDKALAGGGSLALRNASVRKALEHLGYDTDVVSGIEALLSQGVVSDRIIELKKEHRPVFYCSEQIAAKDHLAMVAAVQPFVSGGVSKTVNLPTEATPQDILDCYRTAWELGIKCVSVYRQGSKLSQPWSGPASDCAVCS